MLIVQITDTHIKPHGRLAYRKVDTDAHLERAVAAINALDPAPDLVVVTGDLVDAGMPEEYERLRGLLDRLAVPRRRRSVTLLEARPLTLHDEQRAPSSCPRQHRVEHHPGVDPEKAGRGVAALHVPHEPEAALRHPRDHGLPPLLGAGGPPSTQVSFEPPPWLEFTT